MPHSNLPDQHATAEEFAEAVARLTAAELLRLRKRAVLQIWGTEYTDPMELLGEAVKRAMVAATADKQCDERGRPWPNPSLSLCPRPPSRINKLANF